MGRPTGSCVAVGVNGFGVGMQGQGHVPSEEALCHTSELELSPEGCEELPSFQWESHCRT